jgi:hypothetical protein
MGKKHFTHGRLKVFMTIILAVILIVLVVVCAKKIKLAQNEKNTIGTWKNSSSENVITVQDSEALILYNDIPEAGLYHGNASYHFSYTDTICITQDDISAEFDIDVDENQLIIYFAGQVYLVLQK